MTTVRTYRIGGKLIAPADLDNLAVANREMRGVAMRAFESAKKRGAVTPPKACSGCGAGGRIHGHHADYARPLDVAWLCTRCHNVEHARLREEAAARIGAVVTRRVVRRREASA